jgi:hypothetical protein
MISVGRNIRKGKMKGRILVIKLAAYDSLASSNMRMLAMMKGLDELGYQMDLLCTPPSVMSNLNDMSDYDFLDRVTLVTIGLNQTYENLITACNKGKKSGIKQKILSLMRKVYHSFSLYTNSAKPARQLSLDILPHNEYRYVISVSDPKSSQIALRTLIRKGLKCERVFEYWGDPLSGDITQKVVYPDWVVRLEERKYLKLADIIVYTSPFTLEMEQKNHPMYADRMIFVPTANAFQKFYPETHNDIYTVGYYGAYKSSVRNIMPLYNAFSSLVGKAKLNLVGDTDLELQQTENIMVRPRGVVKDLEEQTDLFVCVLNRSGTQIPGKIYHTAATNKPILVVLDGDEQDKMQQYLNSFDRFIICKNTEEDIVAAIKKIMDDNRVWEPCKLLEPKTIASRIIQ